MTRAVVFQPAQQHAHQLAWALHERGLLQTYCAGTPVAEQGEKLPFWLRKSYPTHVKRVGIPKKLRHHPVVFPGMLRLTRILPLGKSRQDHIHRIFHWFDRWASEKVARLRPSVVICYENAANLTFQTAKAIGALTILDAPSLHHTAQAALATVTETPYLAEINRRKDEEVSLADRILTCSPLAAESYIAAGVTPEKVGMVPLGATLPRNIERWGPHDGPVRFIFAGGLHHLKAIDVILAAFRRLYADNIPYRLTLVGVCRQTEWLEQIRTTPGATYRPAVPQVELFRLLSQSDCLLLPSRFDSFGMVVAEAMACGTPAIVSTQTGAKEMVRLFPGSGWVVECEAESLYKCLKARVQNRAELAAARKVARKASRHFTWQAYRKRVGNLLEEWID